MQGWRVSMEDAHFAATGLRYGDSDREKFSLFGVFDGHGGREVAHFCREHVPREAEAQLRRLRAAKDPQGIEINTMAEAFVRTYNHMDTMMRDPQYESELLSFKKQSGPHVSDDLAVPDLEEQCEASEDVVDGGGTTDGAASGGSNAGASKDNEAVQQVQHKLQEAIATNMARAQQRGKLSKQEAVRIMQGMSFLRRLEASMGSAGATEAALPRPMVAHSVGCTAVCVMITDKHIVCANAGDSRAVLCRGGRAIALSCDHKPNCRTERRRIEEAGGVVKEVTTGGGNGRTSRTHYRVNGDLNLSRAIGDLRHKTRTDLRADQQMVCSTPEIHAEAREPDDEFVVLACDGVWDVKSNAQVCDTVREGLRAGKPLQLVIEELLDACLSPDPKVTQGLGADNMTCMVVMLGGVEAADDIGNNSCGRCLPFRCLRR